MNKLFKISILILIIFSCKKNDNHVKEIELVDKKKSDKIVNNRKSNSDKIPADFYFVYKNFTDTYNSKTKIFTRKYSSFTKAINIEINQKELKNVYNIITQQNFKNLTDNIECDFIYTQPVTYIDIDFYSEKKLYKKSFTIDISQKNCEKVQPALLIDEIMKKGIYKIPKIARLENSDIYLE
ncbi:hypothetical protein [Daejeonia sp. YH14]|uniref:hypothetical protein n=1 Tax=Daejeonia sp. YH14 TaxID=3439042 RepID=UPI003F4917FE